MFHSQWILLKCKMDSVRASKSGSRKKNQTHFDWGMTTETHMVQNLLTPVLQSARWLFSLVWTKCVGWVWLQLCQITDTLKLLTWKLKGTWKFEKSFQFTNNSRAISKWDLCKNELNVCLNRNKKHQLRTISFRFWCMFCWLHDYVFIGVKLLGYS